VKKSLSTQQELKIETKLNRRNKSMKDKLPSYRLYVPVNFIKLNNNSLKVQRYFNSGSPG